jgi:cytochrome c oxidase cbb3-type subunit III
MCLRCPDLGSILIALAVLACDREVRNPWPQPPDRGSFLGNAYQMSEGKLLYSVYNCVGCHAHGGGAIGPALMDARWIYGADPDKIFQSIAEGRPNGMPAFRGKVPDFHLHRLVAYVRSMSGLAGKTVAPARSDHMNVKRAENVMDPQKPTSEARPEPR